LAIIWIGRSSGLENYSRPKSNTLIQSDENQALDEKGEERRMIPTKKVAMNAAGKFIFTRTTAIHSEYGIAR